MKTITLKVAKNVTFLIGLLLFSFIGYTQTTQTFNSSGTFTVPAGVTSVQVEAWGGGGAGGGNNTANDGGGGGGGGAYSRNPSISVSTAAPYTVTVGSGGTGSLNAGTAGGDSWFSTTGTIFARGGAGGGVPTFLGAGGPGGAGGAATGVGTVRFAGGAGGEGRNNNTGQGGPGGSSAGTAAAGTSGPGTWSTITAAAAPTGGGIGGNGGASGANGLPGTSPGGGGGGAGDGNRTGGAGAAGRVVVSWTCPAAYALTAATTNNGPFCGTSASVITVRSSSMPTGTYTVTYNLGGATTATGNTATMNFTAGSPGTGTFSTTTLNIGTTNVYVTNISSGAGCSSVISTFNSTTVVLNNSLPANVSIAANPATTVCVGTYVTFTATPTNGGTSPTYQWRVNGSNVGTGVTYSSSTLVTGDLVTCVMTSNATPCLTGSPATSNTLTMTVNPILNASVSIAASPSNTACAGSTVTFTATPTNGGTTPAYQWRVNGSNVGTGSTYASSTLVNGDVVTCILTSNASPCLTGSPATSNAITMTINPTPSITATTPGSRSYPGTVLLGATASSGTILWYSTLSGGGAIGSGSSWTTPSISTTTTFYCSAQSISGCASTPRTAVVATINNPEMDMTGNGNAINDGAVTVSLANFTDFGSTNSTRTYTISNTGAAVLNIGAITFSGAAATDFTVTTPPASTVAIGASTTFVVTFAPSAAGARNAQIEIANDDPNENPYNFAIQGTGIAAEINVTGNGLTIVDGDTSPTVADWTDFTNVTLTRTFTIQNLGTVPLNISSIVFSGLNASEFSITTSPANPVPGNSSTTFVVTFTPVQTGVRAATLNIVSDDADENPYDFTIIATGVNVDTDNDGVNNSVDLDDDNDGITDAIECGSCLSDPFVNGSFENSTPLLAASTYAFFPVANVPGWQATENVIELWSSGFLGVPAAAGNQFAELNANIAGTLYQSFCLNGASGTITWSIKHRGRSGVDQAFVRFGSTLANALASTPIATMVDGTSAWGLYTGTYIIPAGQTTIVLAFQAGYTASGDASVGNFIDDVQITINQACIDSDGDGIADIIDVDDDNDGIPDIEEAGFKQYSNNTATMDKTNTANWRDLNGNGFNDYLDSMVTAGTYVIPDFDGDGRPNHLDLDSDNDTLFDVDEAGLLNGDGDITGDGRGDGVDTDKDGLLDLYDNSAAFGSAFRAYATNTDGTGNADFIQLDSNNDGIFDIATGLYGSLDANNDGRIDGSGDIDRDGITDTFDTNTAAIGSPRNLDRKLYLNFDGRNDYGQGTGVMGGQAQGSLMAWIDLNSTFAGEGVIVGQERFQLRITSARYLEAVVNTTTVTYNTALSTSRWYHVGMTYDGTNCKLFLNGMLVRSVAVSGAIAADASNLTLGRNPIASNKFFNGKIDEVRVFNIGMTDTQLARMVYQEVQNTSSQVRGLVVPRDIGVPYVNLLRYYRMDAYKDDIIDDWTTAGLDVGSGMRIYNHKLIRTQQAPMPFITAQSGSFATACDSPANDVRGLDVVESDATIIRVNHNITEPTNNTDVAMFVNPGVTVSISNDNKIQNDWYLKLDGKIDLVGRSQLVQTANSELDVTSAGSIERDQRGQTNIYNYNYWSSPVGAMNATTNNNAFTVNGVLRDGTNAANPQNINWVSGYNGSPTSPISLSNYWIFKFQNLTPVYANWASVGPNGTLQAAQGYTLKGSGAAGATQNYTFVGKPNNGLITTPIAPNNGNLSGNPYPSALDANAFITANSSVITGTLYFWEHFSTNTSHNLLQYQGGYAARNLVGGTPPVSPAGISGLGSSTRTPGRYIPVGQGFLVYGSTTGGTITFDNNQRLFIKEDNVSSNVMFRTPNTGGPRTVFNNNNDDTIPEDTFGRVRIGFNAVNSFHRQILLGFMNEHATAGFDAGYDAPQIDTQPNEMSFNVAGTNCVIQGDGFFNVDNIYPLVVKNLEQGDINFTLDAIENFSPNVPVYIYDSETNTYNDIREDAYHVTLPSGTFASRFSLRFKDPANLATTNFSNEEVDIQFTNNDNMINIQNHLAGMTVLSVEMYNMLGQSIDTWNVKDADQTKIQIPVRNVSTGTYIIKVHTTKGDKSEKIIIK